MAVPYNHIEVENKWRKKWEEHPVNVNDGKKPKYYCLDGCLGPVQDDGRRPLCDPSDGLGRFRSAC